MMIRFPFFILLTFSLQLLTLPSAGQDRSHLPVISIDTYGQTIVNEPKITVRIKVVDNGPGQSNSIYDTGNQYDGYAGIEIRGQSSQMFPKKSYGFETRDPQGNDLKTSLLGLPEESDWVLYAPYSDKTLLRNALTFYLGRKMGRWQPGFRFCELWINGSYTGIYQLTEKIKRDKNRVNIDKMGSSDIAGDAVTGGYILKVDKTQDLTSSEYFINNPTVRFSNARNYAWTWEYPDAEDIKTEQKNYFKNFILNVENVLNGGNFTDPLSGYPKYLDIPSFIDFQISNELANNVDGYRYSTFFHKNRDSKGGKLAAGPLWDFDLCYGNVDYSARNLSTSQWQYTNWGSTEGHCMHWWYRLMQDPSYARELKWRYTQLRRGILHTDSVLQYIDSQVAFLGEAVGRNFTRWNILSTYVWPNSGVRHTYAAEVSFLKTWITQRLYWLDTQWMLPVASPLLPEASSLAVYPNPASRILNVKLPEYSPKARIELKDLRGVILRGPVVPAPGQTALSFDLTGVPEGLCILHYFQGNGNSQSISILVRKSNGL